jgi:predicted dehydrogenase
MSKRYKTEHNFADFREMLDRMGDRIDAVTVSIPDHNHAVAAAKAMKMGKHVYCQKPLTHTIWEARRLGEIAREKGVATQMGNQWTAYAPMRKAAFQIRAGQLGTVKEVHVWTNRPIWPQGGGRPAGQPVPPTLNWDLWIGSAPMRPYGGVDVYHPFGWRGWWDFGTGALGDMACHTCNLPFMALNMRDPISVEAECPEHNQDSYPPRSKIKFEFPELDGRAAFTMYWHDGGNLPEPELLKDVTLTVKDDNGQEIPPPYQSGVLIIGDKATMYAAGDYADMGIQTIGADEMEVDYPKSPGHEKEWFLAMHDPGTPAMSNFPDYAGPLTETILLGNLAVWKRGRVEWDPKNLKPLNDPSLEKVVHSAYRDGYEV